MDLLSLSDKKKFHQLLEKNFLSAKNWPRDWFKLTQPMIEDVKYKENPMMEFHEANSGSFDYSEAKIQRRPFVKYKKHCGLDPSVYDQKLKLWNKKKIYALLKNGEIAVAPDDVVAKTVGLRDMSTARYTFFAKMMCLGMEENVRTGRGRGEWKHWFK